MTNWVSQYQKGKTSLDLNEARDDGVLGCSGICCTTVWAKKRGHRLMTTILSNLNQFFFTGRFLSKFAVKGILNIPPNLA